MSVEIPQAFVAYVEERGHEVHVEEYPAWQDDTDWHPAGEIIWMRATEVVRESSYMQVLQVHPAVFDYPERWEMMVDLLEMSLQNSIRRGQAWLS